MERAEDQTSPDTYARLQAGSRTRNALTRVDPKVENKQYPRGVHIAQDSNRQKRDFASTMTGFLASNQVKQMEGGFTLSRKFSAVFKALSKDHPDIVEKKRNSCGERHAGMISSDLSYLYQLNHYGRRPNRTRNRRKFHLTQNLPTDK